MSDRRQEAIKTLLTTASEDTQTIIKDYLESLRHEIDEIYALVDVSRLAVESIGLCEGRGIERVLMMAEGQTHGLLDHLAALIAEGVQE